jgi:hypothetical protein
MIKNHIKEKEVVSGNRRPRSRENTMMVRKMMTKHKTRVIMKTRMKSQRKISLLTFIINLKKVGNRSIREDNRNNRR